MGRAIVVRTDYTSGDVRRFDAARVDKRPSAHIRRTVSGCRPRAIRGHDDRAPHSDLPRLDRCCAQSGLQGIKLSHERIYQMIWDDKRDGGNLWRCLRRRGKRYNKRAGKNAGRGLIPNRIDISERPAIVARKTRLGDWEGDTVVGA